MNNEKRILVLGCGIMGSFLVPELVKLGHRVDVVCLEDHENTPQVTYTKANAKDPAFLEGLLTQNHYDAIVDFLLYFVPEFEAVYRLFLEHTQQYLFLSSYRVYSSLELPIREISPQMIDVSQDLEYLAHEDEYSLYKAREEQILRASGYENFTILRPSIVYSQLRFQLANLEAPVFMVRAKAGKPVILPRQVLDVPATMTWGGDAGRMIAALVGNPKALGQAYSICTAEHHTWREVAEIYRELFGLSYITVDTDTYLGFYDHHFMAKYTLLYDRCAPRIMDNRKVLEATGLRQEDMMPLKQGLSLEYHALPADKQWPHSPVSDAMDQYIKENLL